MQRFVVAIGGLRATSRANWVRLGLYHLRTDGTVTERHWHWTQRRRVSRARTGEVAAACEARRCDVRTAGGFTTAHAPESLTGRYTATDSTLTVTWEGGLTEEWTMSEPVPGKLARLRFKGSSFGATHGFGCGSDAAWATRVTLRTAAAADWSALDHNYFIWKTTSRDKPPFIDTGAGNPFWNRDWAACTGGRSIAGRTSTSQYYLARPSSTDDRRDTLWHWNTALADARDEYCYTGNSHVKPMLQIIDTDGRFHGWVGVEASLNTTVPSEGALGDDIGVFEITDPTTIRE